MTTMVKRALAALLLAAAATGCTTPTPASKAVHAELARAEALFQQGKYADAMMACVDLSRKDPVAPGLAELEERIVRRLADLRADAAQRREASTPRRMGTDVDERRALPQTYGLQHNVDGEKSSLKNPPSAMQKILEKKVTVNLDGVGLDDFIMAIGASEDINIIADNVSSSSTMTVRAEDVPLREILEYIERQLGVSFFVGDSVIWATQTSSGEPPTPMATRMYRLRKGISSIEVESAGQINIVEAIDRFIPKLQGADLLFNNKAHVLIAKNTRENLSKIEDIIEALDVCPPQVLIEARFISTSFSDLRELGVDWILNSPIAVTEKNVLRNGVVATATHTQINPTKPEKAIGFSEFANDAQGLNISYEGVLTDPMFQAVIHALETSGKARTLSVPKVTTVNNRPALIRIGEDFRYFEEYDVQSIPSTAADGQTTYSSTLVPVGTPVLEELGIQLEVEPSVGADLGDITLKIVPEISEFVRYEYYATGGAANDNNGGANQATNGMSMIKLPIFRRSRIETEVVVQSGETVVMGGLISSTENKTRQGVPLLSSLPLIGRLFSHDIVEEKKDNLLIFVTANLISQRGENLIPMPMPAAPAEPPAALPAQPPALEPAAPVTPPAEPAEPAP